LTCTRITVMGIYTGSIVGTRFTGTFISFCQAR
jgi:hypothetical protein